MFYMNAKHCEGQENWGCKKNTATSKAIALYLLYRSLIQSSGPLDRKLRTLYNVSVSDTHTNT